MRERISKLISVKSIVTIALTAAFVYLSVIGKISPAQFMTVFVSVIGFYFGTQHEKKAGDQNG
jgi:hypothetical protein